MIRNVLVKIDVSRSDERVIYNFPDFNQSNRPRNAKETPKTDNRAEESPRASKKYETRDLKSAPNSITKQNSQSGQRLWNSASIQYPLLELVFFKKFPKQGNRASFFIARNWQIMREIGFLNTRANVSQKNLQ